MFLNWPFRAIILTARCTRKFGREIQLLTGKSRLRQAAEQYYCALRHSVPPSEYYRYELYRKKNRSAAKEYLHPQEAHNLFLALNERQSDDVVQDKQKFGIWCESAGLPTVPTIGVIIGGQFNLTDPDCEESGPSTSLFVKPVCGSRGEGAMIWHRLETGEFRQLGGAALIWSQLLRHLQTLNRDLIIQPLLKNDSDVLDLTHGGLSAARIVTGISSDGDIQCIAAAYKMSWKNMPTNTLGLSSAIDLATGELGRAWSYRPACQGYDAHPDTHAVIAGRLLPASQWQQALKIVCRAHQQLSKYTFLGWDVALTNLGVLLVEANSGWDVTMIQKPHGRPLSQTRFAPLALRRRFNSQACRRYLQKQR